MLKADDSMSFLIHCEDYHLVVVAKKNIQWEAEHSIGERNMNPKYLSATECFVLHWLPCDNYDSRQNKTFSGSPWAIPYGSRFEAKRSIRDNRMNLIFLSPTELADIFVQIFGPTLFASD